ncbi:hypothetical protein ACRQ5D_34460 [Mucilaginibacter sp. P25]|uniref:hypothetical protein n=1 Tax=Mucilaginibacter sp. P25 TaxID=3423945 RepID=UPI003D79E968
MDQRTALYEKVLKPYDKIPLLKVTAIKLWVDLFPDEQQARTHGFFTLVNNAGKPIDKLLVDGDGLDDYSLKINNIGIPFSTPLLYPRGKFNWLRPQTDTADYRLFQFKKPVNPGDSVEIEFRSSVNHRGFTNNVYSTDIVNNGTFFNGGIPGLGYNEDEELKSPYERKLRGLPARPGEDVLLKDSDRVNELVFGKAANLFSLDVIISTSGDQTALTNGDLKSRWTANGRNYFHYVQNNPGIYPAFSILSAKYCISRGVVNVPNGKNVMTEVYYHSDHFQNVQRYQDAIKAGLNYYSLAYGEYPFRYMRLAETNVYTRKLTSSANLNTYNENGGWNADFNNRGGQDFPYDYCYYESLKTLAQQWWMFQVAPNKSPGSQVVSDGLPVYDVLVMMEKKYGKFNMQGILRRQLWLYNLLHNKGEFIEQPLITSNGRFMPDKAGVVLYGLRDLIGERNINSALREFKEEYKFRTIPPFAGSNDLYRYLKKYTPDSLSYYLKDTWENITFYNNKVLNTKIIPLAGNKFKVIFQVSTSKVHVDRKGNDLPVEMNDFIDIGIFGQKIKNETSPNNILYLKRMKLKSGNHTISVIVQGKPESVGIDPFNKLIDRVPLDNVRVM